MRAVICLIQFGAIFLGPSRPEHHEQDAPVELVITTDRAEYHSGEPIEVRFELHNRATEAIRSQYAGNRDFRGAPFVVSVTQVGSPANKAKIVYPDPGDARLPLEFSLTRLRAKGVLRAEKIAIPLLAGGNALPLPPGIYAIEGTVRWGEQRVESNEVRVRLTQQPSSGVHNVDRRLVRMLQDLRWYEPATAATLLKQENSDMYRPHIQASQLLYRYRKLRAKLGTISDRRLLRNELAPLRGLARDLQKHLDDSSASRIWYPNILYCAAEIDFRIADSVASHVKIDRDRVDAGIWEEWVQASRHAAAYVGRLRHEFPDSSYVEDATSLLTVRADQIGRALRDHPESVNAEALRRVAGMLEATAADRGR